MPEGEIRMTHHEGTKDTKEKIGRVRRAHRLRNRRALADCDRPPPTGRMSFFFAFLIVALASVHVAQAADLELAKKEGEVVLYTTMVLSDFQVFQRTPLLSFAPANS
jgi:hypothetical protein